MPDVIDFREKAPRPCERDFDEHIATIERLLQIAREMALKL